MRAVVIGNGEITDYEAIKRRLRDDDTIICADGGARHTKPLGTAADIIIGDLDSCDDTGNARVIKYPTDKDFTDGELAVRYAADNGFDELMLLGMSGSRLDHTIADIFLLTLHDNAYFADDNNEIYLLRDSLTISGRRAMTLSVIPLCSELKNVTSTGLKWRLDGDTLAFGSTRGISNIVTDDVCRIEADGMGLVIISTERI